MNDLKSANQLYKESGSNLPFKDWLEQSKKDNLLMKNVQLTNIIEKEKQKLTSKPYDNNESKVFGLNKKVIVISGLLLTAALIYKLTQKK